MNKGKCRKKTPPFLPYRCHGGFTLLELVISITILTLVVLIIGSGFRLGMKAWDRGESETEWTQKFRVLSGLFSQQIKSVFPYSLEIDEDEEVVLFQGEADSIFFVTTLTESFSGGFKWLRYSHQEGALLLKEGLLPDKEVLDHITGDEEVVDSSIEEMQFEYFSQDDDEWKDSWELGEELPRAVRVKISYFDPFVIYIPMASDAEEEDEDEIG